MIPDVRQDRWMNELLVMKLAVFRGSMERSRTLRIPVKRKGKKRGMSLTW